MEYSLREAPRDIIYSLVENEYPSDRDVVDRNALYVLRCKHSSSREVIKKEIVRSDESYYDDPPWWVDTAFDSEELYYIGRYSGDIRERIYKHCNGTGAVFTGVFPPVEIVSIKWIPGTADTGEREEKLANEIRERCHLDGYDACVYYY